MRPRTATIQVSKPLDEVWQVEIGNPFASKALVIVHHVNLKTALTKAVLEWKEKEGLGD